MLVMLDSSTTSPDDRIILAAKQQQQQEDPAGLTPPLSPPNHNDNDDNDERTSSPTETKEEEEEAAATTASAAADSSSSHLARLYRLGESDKEWQEYGFVRVHCAFVDRVVEHCLVLVDSASRAVSFEVPIPQVDYKRDQGTTIITWHDTLRIFPPSSAASSEAEDEPCDVALSFESLEGCDRVWDGICLARGKVQADFRPGGAAAASTDEEDRMIDDDMFLTSFSPHRHQQQPHQQQQQQQQHAHPQYTVTRGNLEQFVHKLRTCSAWFRDRFVHDLTLPEGDYANFAKLLALYDEIERDSPTSPTSPTSPVAAVQQQQEEEEESAPEAAVAGAAPSSSSCSSSATIAPPASASLPEDDAAPPPATPSLLRQRQERREHDLALMFDLVKLLALLDDPVVFELMLREDHFERVAGCLENDPTLPFKADHRRFLRHEARFHLVCPISTPAVVDKIHLRFRLAFLRDVLLSRVLDETGFKRLNNMDTRVSCDIALGLHQDATFLPSLFQLLLHPESPEERAQHASAVQLFAEFNSLVQKLGATQKSDVYKTMFVEGELFDLILSTLYSRESTAKEKLDFEDVLNLAIRQDSMLFQDKMLKGELLGRPETSLMGILVRLAVGGEEDCGVQAMACNLLEVLLDPEMHSSSSSSSSSSVAMALSSGEVVVEEEDGGDFPPSPTAPPPPQLLLLQDGVDCTAADAAASCSAFDDIPFFPHFYAKHFGQLLAVLEQQQHQRGRRPSTSSETLHLVTQVVCFCIQTHGYVIRQVLAEHQDAFASAIGNLVGSRDKHLVLDGVRFVRVLVGMKQRFYDEFVREHGVLELVLGAFARHGGVRVDNLVQSAIIDLYETLYAQNCSSSSGGGQHHHHQQQQQQQVCSGNPGLVEHAAKLPSAELKQLRTFAQLDELVAAAAQEEEDEAAEHDGMMVRRRQRWQRRMTTEEDDDEEEERKTATVVVVMDEQEVDPPPPPPPPAADKAAAVVYFADPVSKKRRLSQEEEEEEEEDRK